MALMDEFKEERESLKNKPLKDKWNYFWYYYKLHVIAIASVIILGSVLIHDIVTSKEVLFHATFINSFSMEDTTEFMEDFASYTDIDTEEYTVFLDTTLQLSLDSYDSNSMASIQKLMAMASAGEIDVFVSDRNIFARYASNEMFSDLRNYLTKEQLERYSDYIFYYDDVPVENEVDTEALMNNEPIDYTDTVQRRDPSTMENPVPMGIFLDGSLRQKLLENNYYGNSQEIVFGIMGGCENPEYCQIFLDFLTGFLD